MNTTGYVATEPTKRFSDAMDAAKHMPGVSIAIKALDEEIALLGSVADDLVMRINPVLHPESPQPANSQPQERPSSCDLDGALLARLVTVRNIRDRLASALSRLEV